MGFTLELWTNPKNSAFFDREFSTFSTLENVDNFLISVSSLMRKWGILEFITSFKTVSKKIKTRFSRLFAILIAHFLRTI